MAGKGAGHWDQSDADFMFASVAVDYIYFALRDPSVPRNADGTWPDSAYLDGSWRMSVKAGELIAEKKESGEWIEKTAFVA